MPLSHTTTTTLLLDGLRDSANAEAWRAFDDRYRPIIMGFARCVGLGDADAADVAQQTLATFVRDYQRGRYDRGRGRLRTWIMAMARQRAAETLRQRARRGVPLAEDMLSGVDDSHADGRLTGIWNDQHERAIAAEAWRLLRTTSRFDESALRAFELTVLRGVSAEAAAAECGISVEKVYVVRTRAAARLRELVEEVRAAYEDDGAPGGLG